MKKIALALLGAALILSCTQERPDVIERPVFEVWNNTTLEIDKIEFTDSATIIHFDAFFRPHWWIKIVSDTYIRESGTDERLLITHAEGIPLDQEFFMPASGETSFKLFFPPLPKTVTKIDFIESDCDDCFKIWGISLLPDTKIRMARIPSAMQKTIEKPLPEVQFSNEKSKISGTIFGLQNGMAMKKAVLYQEKLFFANHEQIPLNISDNGSFSIELSAGIPQVQYIGYVGPVFTVPGKETRVFLDLKRKSRFESRYRTDKEDSDSIYYFIDNHGLSVADLQLSQKMMHIDYRELALEVSEMNPSELQEFFIAKLDEKRQELEQGDYSDKLKQFVLAQFKGEYLNILVSYEAFIRYAKLQASGIPQNEWNNAVFEIESPELDYYSFLSEFLDTYTFYQPNIARNISTLRFNSFFRNPDIKGTLKENYLYFRNKLLPLVGDGNDLFFDIACAQFFASDINNGRFFTEVDKESLFSLLSNPAVGNQLVEDNDRLLALVEANKTAADGNFVVNTVPSLSNDEVFEAILEQHKGKVVVVDFWATWCGPCIHSIEPLKPVKARLADEDVVFVYITDESSPFGLWNEYLPKIGGQHYRVNNELMTYWRTELNFSGIPTFIIFNKQGNEVARFTGFPGPNTIEISIKEALS